MVDYSRLDWPQQIRKQKKLPSRGNKAPAAKKPRRVWRTYDMTMIEIQDLHRSQYGRCANPGCAIPIKPFGRSRAVDHDNAGKIRGMLCKSCNVALGLLYDDPKRIAGLVDYLKRPLPLQPAKLRAREQAK